MSALHEFPALFTLLTRDQNVASRALLQRFGFREVGVLENHARLDGVWRDVVVVERLFERNISSLGETRT